MASYVDRLVDFRDRDNLRRPGGAEAAEYRAAGLKHGPKNSEFSSNDEIEQVLGFPPKLVRKLKPYITVHSRLAGIDVEVAYLPVIQALVGEVAGTSASQHAQRQPVAAKIPAELRVRSGGTVFSVASAAMMTNGGRFVREAVVELTYKKGQVYRLRALQRGDMIIQANSKQMPVC